MAAPCADETVLRHQRQKPDPEYDLQVRTMTNNQAMALLTNTNKQAITCFTVADKQVVTL